jgi:hypothetical protein
MITREQLVKKYVEMLRCGRAAVFLGAGVSKPVGFFDWRELLREPAKELGLDINREHDLIGLAQMYVLRKGNRGRLTQEILNHFGRDVAGTEIHRILAGLPVTKIWTTNYDLVIEETYRREGIDCHVIRDDTALAYSNINAPVMVYKMHGDVSQLNDIVLTRDDYEFYDSTRSAMSSAFYCALVEYTFLFLGFSFNDPNLQRVFGRIRAIFKENSREHFTILREPQPRDEDYQYEKNKFDLFVEDLKRYNIQTVAVKDYGEITEILKDIEQAYYRKSILVSGNGYRAGTGFDEQRLRDLCYRLGRYIIAGGYNLTSGLGPGISALVLSGAMEELYRSGRRSEFHVRFNLFPFTGNQPEMRDRYTKGLMLKSGCCIFISSGGEDRAAVAEMMREYEKAGELGKIIVPVGVTGPAARQVWEREKRCYAGTKLEQAFEALGAGSKSNDEIIKAIFSIISELA